MSRSIASNTKRRWLRYIELRILPHCFELTIYLAKSMTLFSFPLQPEPNEIKKVAAEGILTCLQDAIDSLEQKQVLSRKHICFGCILLHCTLQLTPRGKEPKGMEKKYTGSLEITELTSKLTVHRRLIELGHQNPKRSKKS